MTKELLLAFTNLFLLQDYIWKCSWQWYLGWTWKQCALTVSYVILPFVSSIALFSSHKKWLSYLSHAISPYLYGKLINWTSAFYLSFCRMVLLRILNVLIFMNFNYLYLSIIFYAFSYVMLHCMVFVSIFITNRYIIYLIFIFLVACVGQPKCLFRQDI